MSASLASLTAPAPPPGGAPAPATPAAAPEAWPGALPELLTKLIRYYEDWAMASQVEAQMAMRCRDYYDGAQLTPEEMEALKRRRQPPHIDNYVKRKVDLLRGIERRGRSDPKAYPRTQNEENKADVATQVLRYISDDQRFDVVRSSAYDNLLIEGLCGIEVIVEPDPVDGGYEVVINHVPWHRLFRDPHAEHPGFTDAKYLGMSIWMDREDALDLYPDSEGLLETTFASFSDTQEDRPRVLWSDNRRRVRVTQIWFKRRKDWWTATFSRGGYFSQPVKSPYLDRHGNAACPVHMRACYLDRENRAYGIVRDMLHPQDAINKRQSKLLHLLNVRQVIASEGAFTDIEKMRQEVARPDGVLIHMPNAQFKIDTHSAELGSHFNMLQFAVSQMNATGPNASMAGKDPREQSGRAILAQQAGGMMETEPVVDALRQLSHKVYEAAWLRARQFWTEETDIRVTDNPDDVKFVTLNHPVTLAEELSRMPDDHRAQVMARLQLQPNDPRLSQVVRMENTLEDMDVDITVEEGPDSPTMAAEQFAALMQLPPQVLMQFPPELIIQMSSLRNKQQLLQMLKDHQAQIAQQGQGAQRMQAAQVAKVTADAKDKDASALVRLHGMAVDHATLPGQQASQAMDTASQHVGNLSALHGMAMDHAALPLQQARQAADVQSQGVNDAATAHGMLLDTHAALNPPQPAGGPPPGQGP